MDFISCQWCASKFPKSTTLIDHYVKVHGIKRSESGNEFVCKTDNCGRIFKQLKSLQKHIDTHHEVQVYQSSKNENMTDIKKNWFPEQIYFGSKIAKSVADLRLQTNATGTTIGLFVSEMENILEDTMKRVIEKIKEFFQFKNIDITGAVVQSFLKQFEFIDSFTKYKTIEGQIAALKNEFTFIDPQEKFLGKEQKCSFKKHTDGSKHDVLDLKLVDNCFHYVPILKTLTLVASNSEVMEYIENGSNESKDGFLRNYEDGEHYKNHPLYKQFPNALRIQLYEDDFLSTNPVGSHTHDTKIAAFYFSILNLPPHLNYFIGNVHLVALCLRKYLNEDTLDIILKTIMSEIKLLERDAGFTVIINSKEYTLRGTITSLTADSLAAHELLGFKSCGAKHFCRLCMISRNELHRCRYYESEERNKKLHEEQLQEIAIDESLKVEYGINHRSELDKSKYFNGAENTILDPLHDKFQNFDNFAVKLIAAHIVFEKKYNMDVETLNHRLRIFQYGDAEVNNKPSASFTSASLSKVASDHKLHERAVETWTLLRVFPFLIFDKVQADDPYLRYLINLNMITEIVMAPKLSPTILPYLEDLLKLQYNQFPLLFPDVNRINSLHHIMHYPDVIRKFGPIRNYATFKYEAQHMIFQKYGKHCNNHINITKSMANLGQIGQCAVWGTKRRHIREKLVCNYFEEAPVKDSGCSDSLIAMGLSMDQVIQTCTKVKVYSVTYKLNAFVALESGVGREIKMPIFGNITKIFICNNKVFLYCKEWPSKYLEERLNAYNVVESSHHRLVDVEDLCDPKPFSLWQTFAGDGLNYICLRHVLY